MSHIRASLLVAAAVLAACCGGKGATGPSGGGSQGLVGTWKASKAEFVHASNSGVRVDIVAQGSVVTLTLDTSNYTFTIKDPGQGGNATTGTYRSSTDVLTMTPTGMSFSIEFDMALAGNTLTLNGGSVEFDFNGDGTNEQAKLNMVLARQ